MRKYIKKSFSFLLRVGLSGTLLWVLFVQIDDREKILALVRSADLGYFLGAFVFFGIVHYFVLMRWRIFIKAFDLDVPWMDMVRYFFLGLFGNLFLPTAVGGDVIKTAGLCVHSDQKQKIVASVLLDRLSGFVAMVIISCITLAVGFSYFKNSVLWVVVLLMGIILVGIGTLLFNEKIYRFFCRAFDVLPRLKAAVIQMHYDIALLKGRKKAIFQAVGVSCLSQIFLAATFFLISRAIHQDTLFGYFIIFTPVACVASSFPSIGGLGFREGALEYLLVNIGVAAGIGVSIGLVNFLFMVIVGVCGGIFFIMTKNSARCDCIP